MSHWKSVIAIYSALLTRDFRSPFTEEPHKAGVGQAEWVYCSEEKKGCHFSRTAYLRRHKEGRFTWRQHPEQVQPRDRRVRVSGSCEKKCSLRAEAWISRSDSYRPSSPEYNSWTLPDFGVYTTLWRIYHLWKMDENYDGSTVGWGIFLHILD